MTWGDVLHNVIVPIGVALILGIGGIWAAKNFANRAGKD
jgi:hypothetical protein